MRIQTFSTYQQLALEDKVEPLKCLNSDHPPLVTKLEDDTISLYCLGCSYVITPGKDLHDKLFNKIRETGLYE